LLQNGISNTKFKGCFQNKKFHLQNVKVGFYFSIIQSKIFRNRHFTTKTCRFTYNILLFLFYCGKINVVRTNFFVLAD